MCVYVRATSLHRHHARPACSCPHLPAVPRELFQLASHPWPCDPALLKEYPSGPAISAYISSYADRFDLTPHLRLNCRVTHIGKQRSVTTGGKIKEGQWEISYEVGVGRAQGSGQCCVFKFKIKKWEQLFLWGLGQFGFAARRVSLLGEPSIIFQCMIFSPVIL